MPSQHFLVALHIRPSTGVSPTKHIWRRAGLTRFLDRLRVACDLMALFFIFDHFTDKVDGGGALVYAKVVVDAMRNPHIERPCDEPKLGEITRQ